MRLIYEYGNRREQQGKDKGMKEIINNFLQTGTTLQEISQKTGKSKQELEEIIAD
jgi:lambda repressor-like predicted transcriptional regulator